MPEKPGSRSWWHTLPGILTAIAGVITAISGLIAILNQTGLLPISAIRTPRQAKTDHRIIRRSTFRVPLAKAGSKLHFYDVDAGKELDTPTTETDFFFKPDDMRNPESRIGVAPSNGARFAPRFAGMLPWEVEKSSFTSSGGVYSVEQGKDIPCFTSDGRPCTFLLRLEPQGELFVSLVLYE